MRLSPLFMILFTAGISLHAECPYTLTSVNHINAGDVNHIVLRNSDTLYSSCGDNGLNIYCKNGQTYSRAAHADDGGQYWVGPGDSYSDWAHANDVLLFNNDIILGNGADGTRAYGFGSSGLICKDYIDNKLYYDGGTARGLAQYNDSLILQANSHAGLRAYSYRNGTFSKIAHIDNGHEHGEYYNNVCVSGDGTIFVANGVAGLRVYSFEDSKFVYRGQIGGEGYAYDVTVSDDGTVFLANGDDGVRVYSYSRESEKIYPVASEEVAFENITMSDNGMIFLARGSGGTSAYSYDGQTFSFKGWINAYSSGAEGPVRAVAPLNDSTLAAAHSGYGLKVYDCDFIGWRFHKTAEFDNDVYFHDVAVNDDGIIYAACSKGLRAYEYDPLDSSIVQLTPSNNIGDARAIHIADSGIVFAAFNDGTVRAYEYTGTSFTIKARAADEFREANDVVSLGADYVFASKERGGLYVYRYDEGSLTEIFHQKVNDNAMSVAVASDSTVVLGCNNNIYRFSFSQGELILTDSREAVMAEALMFDNEGTLFGASDGNLTSYTVRGYDLENIAHQDNGGISYGVTVFDDHLVLSADGAEGLRAYTFNGSNLNLQAEIYEAGTVVNMQVGPDSLIYTAAESGGIRIYQYSGYDEIARIRDSIRHVLPDPADAYSLAQNYPNPFNGVTNIVYELSDVVNVDLIIYDISGRRLRQWTFQDQAAGRHRIVWNGKDQRGNILPSGVYILNMTAGVFHKSEKMLLMK